MDHATLKPTHAAQHRGIGTSAGTAAPPGSASALPVGSRLREFELTGVIGEGGFSIVYAAMDQRLGREVAIKEYIPASLARRDDGFSVRVRSEQHEESFSAGLAGFMNEARLLAQFKHPALVEVLQFWEQNGTAYMAMPRYHGRTLRQVLRERGPRCDENWLKRTLAPVLDVLELLHERSVFHRDIAPDNILVQRDDRAVLLDLGSAREILGDREQCVTVVVKPGYAPLEQYSGEFSLPQGPWTDVYAFGAVLHFAVTGTPPQASISRVMKDSRPLLAETPRAGFSTRFLQGIDAALALQPADRPQSAAELRALLAFDEVQPTGADREAVERALDALHVDEAITAIVSAEEMADIAAQLAASSSSGANQTAAGAEPGLVSAKPPSAHSRASAESAPAQTAASAAADPMAAPASAPAAPVFKDVEDLVAGKLLPNTADVRVVSESRLEARIDTETPAAAGSGRQLSHIAMLCGAVLLSALGGWWLLSGRADTDADAQANAPTEDTRSARRLAPVEAPVVATARSAAVSDPAANSAARPVASRGPAADATNPIEANAPQAVTNIFAAPATLNLETQPQPSAAIPDEVWASGEAVLATTSAQPLPLVDLRDSAASGAAGMSDGNRANGSSSRAQEISASAAGTPSGRRTAPAQADLVGVRVSVSPWAELWVGGERKGVSPPVRELKLPVGQHRVELRNPAFPARTVEINVRQGEHPAIEHRFSAADG